MYRKRNGFQCSNRWSNYLIQRFVLHLLLYSHFTVWYLCFACCRCELIYILVQPMPRYVRSIRSTSNSVHHQNHFANTVLMIVLRYEIRNSGSPMLLLCLTWSAAKIWGRQYLGWFDRKVNSGFRRQGPWRSASKRIWKRDKTHLGSKLGKVRFATHREVLSCHRRCKYMIYRLQMMLVGCGRRWVRRSYWQKNSLGSGDRRRQGQLRH